jgi:ActR/RegA family two-component response regulator
MTYILHLEDDGPLRDILRVAFEAIDPKVNLKQFANSDDIIAHIKQNLPTVDLCVLDIRVPGSVDGLGVARKIRELDTDVPIIVTSAYRAPDREILASISAEWMPKPWHIMEITGRLVTIARRRKTPVSGGAPEAAPATENPESTVTPPVVPKPAAPTPPAAPQPAAPTPVVGVRTASPATPTLPTPAVPKPATPASVPVVEVKPVPAANGGIVPSEGKSGDTTLEPDSANASPAPDRTTPTPDSPQDRNNTKNP